MMKEELKTEQIFERMTVPFNKAEWKALEKSLLSEGCIYPIITWNGVILDGHKRYRICRLEEIDFGIKEMHFSSLEDAVLWVCRKRTHHLSKSRLIYKYLVGKWYTAGIIINRRKEFSFPEENMLSDGDTGKKKYRTSIEMGRELGHNHATIEQFKRIMIALDAIALKDPELFDLLMLGEYKASYEKIQEMSGRSQRHLQEERRRFQRQMKQKLSLEKAVPLRKDLGSDRLKTEEIPLSVGIKEMPIFDPDMELRGLALTLPTWMNALERARLKTDMGRASDLMKRQLADILSRFRQQIDQMMEVL